MDIQDRRDNDADNSTASRFGRSKKVVRGDGGKESKNRSNGLVNIENESDSASSLLDGKLLMNYGNRCGNPRMT
jgi:hypothetical protein